MNFYLHLNSQENELFIVGGVFPIVLSFTLIMERGNKLKKNPVKIKSLEYVFFFVYPTYNDLE